ncbi:hypothetical protein AQUCO_00900383v1 [Aquilegia coerulea]|nr:hypothetical protein AQUCO_00900383v1 [Aquilegia coerulea]
MNSISTTGTASSFLLTFSSTSSSSSSSNFSKSQIYPSSSSSSRFTCRNQLNPREDLPFILHDTLQTSGIDITHAKDAREGFCSQIKRLSKIERQVSIAINASADLAKTALLIAAEDDALVSHSSVPLPVKSFLERLDTLSMGFVSHYSLNLRSASPELFLDGLEKYLYGYKGFRRAPATDLPESRDLYLHSVLTHRSGSAVMLSLIYSEILKMLRMWGLLNYDVEIYCPRDEVHFPKGYLKQKSKLSDQPYILTQQSLLVEILRSLKEVFWPFRYDPGRSLFLRAACAAKCISGPNTAEETAFERASTKAAQHRLERGVWTSVRLGDMRRALAASERLILLDHDVDELRDYSILLYHCGFYKESWHYLSLYKNST